MLGHEACQQQHYHSKSWQGPLLQEFIMIKPLQQRFLSLGTFKRLAVNSFLNNRGLFYLL